MSSISSVSFAPSASYSSVKTQKPDTSSLVDTLFEKLDTKQQGYIDKSALQTALTSAASKASNGLSSNADDLFAKMDSDGDGKITKQEMGNTLQSLLDQVDNLAAKIRIQGSPGGAQTNSPDDQGFTKDQLVQMTQDASKTDSKHSALMSNIADNFDDADADANGKVTRDEAMSYAQSTGQEKDEESNTVRSSERMSSPPPRTRGSAGDKSETEETSSATATSTTLEPADINEDGTVSAQEALNYLLSQLGTDESTETTASNSASEFSEKIARQILQLVQTYGTGSDLAPINADGNSTSSNLSTSA